MLKKSRGKKIYFSVFSVACLVGTSIGLLSNEIVNQAKSSTNNISFNNIEKTRSYDTTSRINQTVGGYTTDNNNAIVYNNASIIDDTAYFGNAAVSINNNAIIGIVKGSINTESLALFDTRTNTKTIVSNTYQSISDIYYDASLNILLAIVKSGSQYLINSYQIDDSNNLILKTSKVMFSTSDVSSHTSLKIFKIANANSYIVTTKISKTNTNRPYCQINCDENGITGVSNFNMMDSDSNSYILMAAGFAWVSNTNVCIQLLTNNYNTFILKAFKNNNCVSTFNLTGSNSIEFDVSDINVKAFSDIVMNTDNDGVSATVLVNGVHASIINAYFQINSNKLIPINEKYSRVDTIISLDCENINIDITRACYMNDSIYFLANNWRTPWDNPIIENYAIGVLNLKNIQGTSSTNSLTLNTLISTELEGNKNPRLRFIKFFASNVAYSILNKLSILPMTNASFSTGDISLYGTTSDRTSIWSINQELNNGTGGFSYQTNLIDNNYTYIDATYTDARLITNKEINSSFKNKILSLFQGYSTVSNITIEKVPNNNDLWLLGKLPITVYFSKGYDSNGKPAKITKQVTLTGFKVIPTSILNNGVYVDETLSQIVPNEYNITRLTAYVNNKAIDIFDNLPSDATISVIEDSLVFNLNNGSISMKISPSSYINDEGQLVDNENLDKKYDFTLSGFMSFSDQTTIIPSNIKLNSLNTILASEANNFIDEIKTNIISSNVIQNIAYNQTLTTNDIDLEFDISTSNNSIGQIVATITIKNGKYWENGTVIDTKSRVTTLSGFRIQPATSRTSVEYLVNNFWNQYYAGEVSESQYENFLNSKINELFTNVPPNANVKIVNRITNVTVGEEGLIIKLDKWYDSRGMLQTNLNESPEYNVKISGFKRDNLSTYVPTSMNLPLSGFLASDILTTNPSYNQNVLFLKQLIINSNLITNIANNQQLTESDLQINVITNTVDNISGTANIELTILNNKAWLNGNPQERFTQTVILSGFNTQQPTEQKNNSYRNSSWININSNSFTAQDINNLLNRQKSYFLENIPADAYLSVIQNEIEYNLGYIICSFTIDKYFNKKGILQTTNLPKFNIMLTGFKTSTSSTIVPSSIDMPSYYQNIFASDIQDNSEMVIQSIIDTGTIIDTNGNLTLNDIQYVVISETINNCSCELQIELTIKNNKYLINGVPQFAFTKVVTLKGFKQQNPTNSNIVIDFKPTATTIDGQIEELKKFLDENPMVPNSDPYYIPDANGDNIINSDDFIIEAVDGVLVFKPIYIYNENGIKVENNGSSTLYGSMNDTNINKPTSSFKLLKVHLLIIIIASSVVGLLILILILWLIFRSRLRIYYEDYYYDVDYEDYYR